MKNHLTVLCLVLFCFIPVASIAQNTPVPRISLFDSLPNTINCTTADLNQFFISAKGQSVKASFSNRLNISGSVISNSHKFSNLHSVIIRLPDFKDAVFSISKRTGENNKTFYTGHIIQPNASEVYELKKNGEDTYQLVKIKMEDILPACIQQ